MMWTESIREWAYKRQPDLACLLSWLVPKRRDLLAFICRHDPDKFAGNVKHLFLYAQAHQKSYRCVFLAERRNVAQEIRVMGHPVAIRILSRIWLMLRARYIITDGTDQRYTWGRFAFIQLWHGTGFKNVGVLNDVLNPAHKKQFARHYSHYRLVVATSEDDRICKNDSFLNPCAVITGSPRNDALFVSEGERNRMKDQYGLSGFRHVIGYAPTFRDAVTRPAFSDGFWGRLNAMLQRENGVFVVKKHPWERSFTLPAGYTHIRDLSPSILDAQDLLVMADMLVSDYSSIVTDYALLGRPMIFYMHDYAEYLNTCRCMYYDIRETVPGPFVATEDDLLEKMSDWSWFQDEALQARYREFTQRFHTYTDGNSCKRVFEAIQRL